MPLDDVTEHPGFLSSGGELGRLIAEFDWSKTSLGPIDSWSQVVKTTVALNLRSPVPIVTLWGEDGVMIYNDAYSIFAAGRHPKLLGSKVREGWPEVADFNDNVMKTVFERGETLSYQDQELTLFRTGVAEQVWMNLDYSQIVHDDGRPAGVIAIVVETTAKVRAEQRLSGEHQRLAQMLDEAPGFMALLEGPDHVFTMANKAYHEVVGGREIIGKRVADAIPEASAQGFIKLLDDVYASGEPFIGQDVPVTLSAPTAGSGKKFIDFIYQPVTDPDGRITGIFVQGHDVSSKQEAVQAIRESEERFRLVAERAPVMLWMGHADGSCAYLNKMQRDFWGVDLENISGFDWGTTIHEEDRESLHGPFSKGMSEHVPFSVEARFRRADGEYRLLRSDAQPRFDSNGEFLGMIGVNVDVTETRQAQQRLSELNEDLERRVVEEISERRVAEMALQQAQKMESIGKLTGGIAHDFNNLLQIISGNLQLLQVDVAGNASGERRIANAMQGVTRGAKLASQLLAFARRQPLEPKVVNIGRMVAGLEDLLQRSLGEAVEIETVVSPSLWNSFVDPTQIENAVLNLAINGRDAMDGQGKLTIEVSNASIGHDYARANPEIEPGQYVMVAVSDTGSGIAPEILGRVFDPFFTTKGEGKGSGLGLSMVYGFVKQSGGHVKIYSEPGEGTTVRMYLPRVHEKEAPLASPDQLETRGGSECILVVEDDEEVRSTVTEMLGELGYKVLVASDGQRASEIIEQGAEIDLLFTDVVMPGPLRSPALARKAQERAIPVLFTSGYTENAIVHGGRLDPGVDLLPKPYTRQTLAARIRDALNRSKKDRG
jgi:PAS domain S-box-containing protein